MRQTQIAAADAGRVQDAVAEAQLKPVAAQQHFEDAAAFFRLLGTAPIGRVEHHAVARLERRDAMRVGRLDHHAVGDPRAPPSHQNAAMARRAALHHRLMIRCP